MRSRYDKIGEESVDDVTRTFNKSVNEDKSQKIIETF
jgi:truncated hemoglobin YjbI